jgi:hypothetical protein
MGIRDGGGTCKPEGMATWCGAGECQRTQLRHPGVGDKYVARLQVPVHHPAVVQVLHPRRNLAAVEQHRLDTGGHCEEESR